MPCPSNLNLIIVLLINRNSYIFSPPVLLHGGLLGVAVCLSVIGPKFTRSDMKRKSHKAYNSQTLAASSRNCGKLL